MVSHDDVNKQMRRHRQNMVISSQDRISNAGMNSLMRGEKTLAQVKAEHKPRKRKTLSLDETRKALEYMETAGCRWSEAVAHVVGEAEVAAKEANEMNAMIRAASGRTGKPIEKEISDES